MPTPNPSPNPPDTPAAPSERAGVLAGVAAFSIWGIFPIYWKLLDGVPPLEIIAHRVALTLIFLLVVVPLRGHTQLFLAAIRSPRQTGLYFVSGSLLACNWLTFIYAVLTGQILETSLGYFLTPLFNVLMGLVFLRERLRAAQWLAVALAVAGVIIQVYALGRLPWISLVLGCSFATYGLLRKQGPLGPLTGLAVETATLVPFALGFIVFLNLNGQDTVWGLGLGQQLALLSTGAVTALPLLLFAVAARSLPLSTVGLLQYLAPSLQFLVGVFLYGETFAGARVVSFVLIWIGLAIYTTDSVRDGFRRRMVVETP